MIQCDICQVVNEDAAQFCRECGGRLAKPMAAANPEPSPVKPRPKLHSPILGGTDDSFDNEPEEQTIPRRKNKKGLRSPMLGGGEDDDFEEEEPQPEPQKRSGRGGLRSPILGGKPEESDRPKGRGGLRSPILGGGAADDYEDEPAPTARKGKGGLRSPMLGGSEDFDDDSQQFGTNPPGAPRKGSLRSHILGGGGGGSAGKSHIEFPHRSHDLPQSDEEAPGGHGKPAKGLRSPLLGGDDGDFEEMPAIDRGRGHGTSNSRPGRLRSPILGGSGDEFDDFDDEDDADDEPDENALRSPLLAVRAPRHEKPKAAPKPETQPQAVMPTPVPAPAPLPAPAQPPQQIQAQIQPQPQQNYEYGVPGAQFSASPGASSTQLPQMPQAPPRYQPQPAPKPTNSNYRMPEQTLVHLEPARDPVREPAPSPPAPAPVPTPTAPPSTPASQVSTEEKSKPPEKLRSRLLSGDEPDDFVGPSDRRALGDRRTGPRPSRRSSDNQIDVDDEDFSYGAKGSGGAPNSMAPMAMALIGVALIAKAWFIFSYFKGDPMTQTSMIADQLTSTVALIGAIMMASRGARPN